MATMYLLLPQLQFHALNVLTLASHIRSLGLFVRHDEILGRQSQAGTGQTAEHKESPKRPALTDLWQCP